MIITRESCRKLKPGQTVVFIKRTHPDGSPRRASALTPGKGYKLYETGGHLYFLDDSDGGRMLKSCIGSGNQFNFSIQMVNK